jgi:hypothetical protein
MKFKFILDDTPGYRNGTESFFGLKGSPSVVWSRVERLPPSPHVKESSVTAHYEHAHDEWSIRDLLHWQNYPSLPITFPCFESHGV